MITWSIKPNIDAAPLAYLQPDTQNIHSNLNGHLKWGVMLQIRIFPL